jgi:hypothetical protein
MVPHHVEALRVALPPDAGGADQAGKGARRIGASRKSKNVEFVARQVIVDDEPVTILHDYFQSQADGAAENFPDEIRLGAHSGVIERLLYRPVRAAFLDQRLAAVAVGVVEFCQIGGVADPFLIPGAVDQNHDSFHRSLHGGGELCVLADAIPCYTGPTR